MWTRVRGLRVHARVSAEPLPPDAPTIVLVHGVAVSHRYLLPIARHLAPLARVYLPDLPGYGKSDKPPIRDLTVPDLADWLVAWMDAVGLERAHMLGNSFGCQILADFAVRYPERVERLVLQGPTMDPRARTAVRQVARWLATSVFERKSEAFVLLRDLLDLGVRRLVGMIGIGLDDAIERKLPGVCAPTLVVRGSRDLIVPEQWAEVATALLPNGRLVVVEGAAHTINYSQPAWLRDVIWPFLTEDADAAGMPPAPEPATENDANRRTAMGTPADRVDEHATKADGSEPGGGSGMENIERLAGDGVRNEPEAGEERRVEQLAAGVGDTPDAGDAGRRDRDAGPGAP